MPDPAVEAAPDHFLVGRPPDRLPDGGPRYKETPADLAAVGLAEPFNAVTASFFVVIVAIWVVRLWGRYRRFPFISCCIPVLLIGGIGGTLYHATRAERAWFLMDVLPITLLGTAAAVYLTVRLGKALGLIKVFAVAVTLVIAYLAINAFVFRMVKWSNPNWGVNLSYASLAFIMLVPLIAVLVKTRFRHIGWVAGGLASFGIAWFCRLVDNTPYGDLPMGTHWLWHTFGAITTYAITEYFYRLEGETIGEKPGEIAH